MRPPRRARPRRAQTRAEAARLQSASALLRRFARAGACPFGFARARSANKISCRYLGRGRGHEDGAGNRTDVLRASPPMFESGCSTRSRACTRGAGDDLPARDHRDGAVGPLERQRGARSSGCSSAATRCGRCSSTGCTGSSSTSSRTDGLGARFHWIIHGVHHDHPNDPLRLVMPPAVSVPLARRSFFGDLCRRVGSHYSPSSRRASSRATWSTT